MDKQVFSANATMLRVVVIISLIFNLLFMMVIDVGAHSTLYAKPSAVGNGDCSNWDDACTLQEALDMAESGDEIWVAKGLHYAGIEKSDIFYMKSGVEVYGGFIGTETQAAERDWVVNPTILSGDIDHNDTNKDANGIVMNVAGIIGENTRTIVLFQFIDSTGVLDGFIINAGKGANNAGGVYISSGAPTLKNLVISSNTATAYAAGLYNTDGAPTLTNVAFLGNSVTNADGRGAMFNYKGNPMLVNVLFSGNQAVFGGGLYSWLGSVSLVNTTFSGNNGLEGGAIYVNTSNITLTNAIIWGNSSAIDGNVAAVVTNSIVQGGYPGGNLDVDPQFVNPVAYTSAPTTAGDYHLRYSSLAIDAGNNFLVTALTDLDGKSRIFDGNDDGVDTVDLGAYEWFHYSLFLPLIVR